MQKKVFPKRGRKKKMGSPHQKKNKERKGPLKGSLDRNTDTSWTRNSRKK